MHLIAGVDEIASETQVSEGWTYAVFPHASIQALDQAVSGGSVKSFHGKKFKQTQAAEYELFLKAIRAELEKEPNSRMLFTLQDLSWKNKFVPFAKRLISGALKNVGVLDPSIIQIAEHLFPGVVKLQGLICGMSWCSIEIEVDSDSVSEKLRNSAANFGAVSVPTANLLSAAYGAYRNTVFRTSPVMVHGGIKVLKDAKSRAIQAADVFGNFALSFLFFKLGDTSNKRAAKAKIFENVFGDVLDTSKIHSSVALFNANDIKIINPGGFTLSVSLVASG